MRKLYFSSLTLLCLSLTLTPSAGAQEAAHTIVKLFENTPNLEEIIVDLPGLITVEHWDSPHLRTTLEVQAEGISDKVFKTLLVSGRYRTAGNRQGCTYLLTAPNLVQEVLLNGRPLAETYTFTVKVPRGVTVRLKSDLALAGEPEAAPN